MVSRWIAAVAGLWLVACLPARYTDAELQAKAAATNAADATASEVAVEVAVGPGCGNGIVEDQEECDENGAICGGCSACQRRRALDATSIKAVAVVPNAKAKSVDKVLGDSKSGLSIEAWFTTVKLPAIDGADAFAVIGTLGGKNSASWVMGLKREGDKNAMYATCAYSYGIDAAKQFVYAQSADPVTAANWHHLRCAISGKTSKMMLSLDGGAVRESANAVGKLTGTGSNKSLFEPTAALVIGAIAMESNKPDERFSGSLDELRIVVGSAADDFGQFRMRYTGTELGTQLLYHMDLGPDDKALVDSSVNGLLAQQASTNDGFGTHVLMSVPENCYGLPADAATCKVPAAWCP